MIGPDTPTGEIALLDDRASGAEEVGLDDLFGTVEGQPAAFAGSGNARWLLGRAFLSVAVGAVIYGGLMFLEYVVPYPLIVVTVFTAALVKHLLSGLGIRRLPRQLTGQGLRAVVTGRRPYPEADDGIAIAVGQWQSKLVSSGRGRGKLPRQTVSDLRDLVDERLRQRHGVTRDTDPVRAQEMMGEHLWRMLHATRGSSPTQEDVALAVQRIEEL